MPTPTPPSQPADDARIASMVRRLNDEIELHPHHHETILELAEQCLALTPRAAAHIAQSRFPSYAARNTVPWTAKALGAELGFTDPRHPLSDAAAIDSCFGAPSSRLDGCALSLVQSIQKSPDIAFEDAELLCKLALRDTLSPAGSAFAYACEKQRTFNPMRALEKYIDTAGFGLFDNFDDTACFARAMLAAPGWRPDSDLGLLQWLASALDSPTHSPSASLLFSTIASRAPCQRVASLFMLARAWGPFEPRPDPDAPSRTPLFERAFSRARSAASDADARDCATQAARHASGGMAEFLAKPTPRGAPRPCIDDFCSGDARAWAFKIVAPDDIPLFAPRDRLAWLDFSIASGQWRHAARAIDSQSSKASSMALSPLAIARCLANPFLPPFARDNQALPFLRKAMRFSGRPAAFAAELSEAPSEWPIPPALLSKLLPAGASVERTTLRGSTKARPSEAPRLAKRL